MSGILDQYIFLILQEVIKQEVCGHSELLDQELRAAGNQLLVPHLHYQVPC